MFDFVYSTYMLVFIKWMSTQTRKTSKNIEWFLGNIDYLEQEIYLHILLYVLS